MAQQRDYEVRLGGSYIYRPLATPTTIRILRLEPRAPNDLISCTTLHVDLKEESPDPASRYEAISYVWGADPAQRSITCDGMCLSIRQNLYNALCLFRDSESTRHLWADAICINQRDNEEKGVQVGLMNRVYSQATKVLVYLGQEDDTTVISMFGTICGLLTAARLINIPEPEKEGTKRSLSHARREPCFHFHGQKHEDWVESCIFENIFDPISDEASAGLKQFYQNPYFLRGWVQQEVALAREARVYLGNCSMDLWQIGFFSTFLATNRPMDFANKKEDMLGFVKCKLLAEYHGDRENTVFLNTLCSARSSCFTDPRDRVYGLLAFGQSAHAVKIRPKYHLSTLECYRELAEDFLINGDDSSVLSTVRHEGDINPDWPSWIPDWRIGADIVPLFQNLPLAKWDKIARSSWRRLWYHHRSDPMIERLRKIRIERYHGKDCLTIKGMRIDAVDNVTGHDVARKGERSLWNLLKIMDQVYPSDYVVSVATGGRSRDWDAWTSMLRGTYQNFLRAWEQREMRENDTSIDDTDEPDAFLGTPLFSAEAQAALDGRCIFQTGAGLLGLGPDIMRKGDIAVVFLNGLLPFILRPSSDGLWRLVGECYLDVDHVGSSVEAGEIGQRAVETFRIF